MWLFDLALKLLQQHYVHVDGFEQKVKNLLSKLIQFETDDANTERTRILKHNSLALAVSSYFQPFFIMDCIQFSQYSKF